MAELNNCCPPVGWLMINAGLITTLWSQQNVKLKSDSQIVVRLFAVIHHGHICVSERCLYCIELLFLLCIYLIFVSFLSCFIFIYHSFTFLSFAVEF